MDRTLCVCQALLLVSYPISQASFPASVSQKACGVFLIFFPSISQSSPRVSLKAPPLPSPLVLCVRVPLLLVSISPQSTLVKKGTSTSPDSLPHDSLFLSHLSSAPWSVLSRRFGRRVKSRRVSRIPVSNTLHPVDSGISHSHAPSRPHPGTTGGIGHGRADVIRLL